jgi:hypothetical protein
MMKFLVIVMTSTGFCLCARADHTLNDLIKVYEKCEAAEAIKFLNIAEPKVEFDLPVATSEVSEDFRHPDIYCVWTSLYFYSSNPNCRFGFSGFDANFTNPRECINDPRIEGDFLTRRDQSLPQICFKSDDAVFVKNESGGYDLEKSIVKKFYLTKAPKELQYFASPKYPPGKYYLDTGPLQDCVTRD